MKAKILLLSVILVIVFSSCEKSENEISIINGQDELLIPSTATLVEEKSTSVSDVQEIAEAEDFARLLAMSINDKDVRKFLKNEANKKFDGDYDILVSNILESKISGLSFKDQVAKSSPSGKFKGHDVISNALKNEKLNISIPLHIDSWKELKQQLLVAVSVGTVEGKTEYVKAFDSMGNMYVISTKEEPNVPVIVVGNNERMDYEESSSVVAPTEFKSAFAAVTRTQGYFEKITYIKCTDLDAIEDWTRGAPEIYFDAIAYRGTGAYNASGNKRAKPSSRDQARTGWNPNIQLFQWFFETSMGDVYYINAIEKDDNGVTIKIPITITGKYEAMTFSAGLELTYKEGDDKLPSQAISTESNNPTTIYDDRIKYTVMSLAN